MIRTIAIAGGGVAGGTAAITLRTAGFDGRIVLVSAEPGPPRSRPPLSKQVLRGASPAARADLRPAAWFAQREIELVSGTRIEGLDVPARRLALSDGSVLAYDQLLLATGGRPRALACGPVEGMWTLRTTEDSLAIGERLRGGASLIVVGAGFIGAEVAATARELGCDVTMVEAADQPMERVLPAELGRVFADLHTAHGVRVVTGAGVAAARRTAAGVAVRTTAGQVLEADLVVVGIGLVPNLELAEAAGLPVGDGILVDEGCRTPADGVFAAGDVANYPHRLLGRRVRVEHWQNAQHQGAVAARNMLGRAEVFAEIPWVWSDQYGLNVQLAGDPSPADTVHVVAPFDGPSGGLALLSRAGRVTAVLGVDRAEEVRAVRHRLATGLPVPVEALLGAGGGLVERSGASA